MSLNERIEVSLWLIVIGVYIVAYFAYKTARVILQMSELIININKDVSRVDRRTERMEIKLAEKGK